MLLNWLHETKFLRPAVFMHVRKSEVQSNLALLQLFLSLKSSMFPQKEPAVTAQVGAGVGALVDVV
jgi:hypothetical protein